MAIPSKRSVNLEHFKNIVAVAIADGYLEEAEKNFLRDKARELNLPFDEVNDIINTAQDLQFTLPCNAEEKEDQLTDAIYITMINGEINKKEYQLCVGIAERMGLGHKDVDEIIGLVKKLWY